MPDHEAFINEAGLPQLNRQWLPDHLDITVNGNHVGGGTFDRDHYLAIYSAIWQNMDRENALINHRISWALWITAAFITAQAFITGSILQYGKAPDMLVFQGSACFFMAMMSIAAVYGTWRVKEAVGAAITQLSYLKYYYLQTKSNGQNLFESYLHLPRPFGDPAMHKSGNNAAKTFAPALMTLWVLLTLVEVAAGLLLLSRHIQRG